MSPGGREPRPEGLRPSTAAEPFAAGSGWEECDAPVQVPGWVCRWFWHEADGWFGLQAALPERRVLGRVKLRPSFLADRACVSYVPEMLASSVGGTGRGHDVRAAPAPRRRRGRPRRRGGLEDASRSSR